MNSIGKIAFSFNMQNELFARELFARWDSFFMSNFERIADEVLTKHDKPGQVFEIERLELDLGSFSEEDFDEQFPLSVREKLEKAIIRVKEECENTTLSTPYSQFSAQVGEQQIFIFKLLAEFLLHGTLPWSTPSEYQNIPRLFTVVLQQEGARLKRFLQTYGHYTSLQERLACQLNDLELEKGVSLLQPSNSAFICSYIRLLHAKYDHIERPGLEKYVYKKTVWQVVYAYLLNNRGSYFDKKNFLAQTILRLATTNNVYYERLLEMITRELEHFFERLTIPAELFRLLDELREELSERQFQRSAFSAAKFYRTIAGILQREIRQGINDSSRERLLQILSRADSCRAFLQQLTEPEIIGLVPIVIQNKNDSDFVIQTAKTMDNDGRGMDNTKLETGSEKTITHYQLSTLNLIKWQIIFPLLLSNRGATLNFKYFVESMLRQIAAHYNLQYSDLLVYVYQSRNLFASPLRKILVELVKSVRKNTARGISKKESAMNNAKLTAQEIPHLPLLTTQYCHELIKKYFPDESEFIISYTRQLDVAHEKGFLEGKTGGEFSHLKWKFIFSVLLEISEHAFNRRFFVDQTLQRMASHYNLAYFDLLAYFQITEAAMYVTFELQTLLNELFFEEKKHWINIALHGNREANKFKIIKVLFPTEQPFLKTYTQSLDYYHKKGLLQGKTSGDFRQIKWKIVFDILFEVQKTTFNKRQFIKRSLEKLAAHYNLSLSDLLSWLCAGNVFASASPYKEIAKIFNELYQEQKTDKSTRGKTIINVVKKYLLPQSASVNERVLFETLSRQTVFITYVIEILSLLPELRRFLRNNFQLFVNNEKILQFLLQTSAGYHSLSRTDILKRFIEAIATQLSTEQKEIFYKTLIISNEKLEIKYTEKVPPPNPISTVSAVYPLPSARKSESEQRKMKNKKSITHNTKKCTMKQPQTRGYNEVWKFEDKNSVINNEESETDNEELVISKEDNFSFPTTGYSFINNAGIVLLSPYLPRLFDLLKVTENSQFKDHDKQIRAIFLMQYAAFGAGEFPEHELVMNKLLTGFETEETLPKSLELTQEEKETIKNMLDGVLQNWPKLRNTSIAGLQGSFLQRNGKLEEHKDFHQLTVEEKAYDMLLDSCPWNFRTIRYPWMGKMIQVKWR